MCRKAKVIMCLLDLSWYDERFSTVRMHRVHTDTITFREQIVAIYKAYTFSSEISEIVHTNPFSRLFPKFIILMIISILWSATEIIHRASKISRTKLFLGKTKKVSQRNELG